MRALLAPLVIAALVAGLLAIGCASQVGGDASSGSGKLEVVAAENFWGSLAAQLGGVRVRVHSIIVNPATDPHSYEPTAADARAMAGARLAIVNGLGYDEWASKLLAASPLEGRAVLDVGSLLGLRAGANPHRWYYPSDVRAVVRQIVRDYDRLDPSSRAYFARREELLETRGLARYEELLRELRERYAGVAVGYSESIFEGLGEYVGLKLVTPYGFAKAIAEGGEVTAQDKRTVDRQAETHEIAVWVLNSQNVTPDVQRVSELARAAGIPIATVTETLSPAHDSFEQWQVAELEGLRRALRRATGR
ncbi:MAG TPA: zinc ABC transporter substrate-binding protein [Solirubrobacteraceae bacterium]|jgi:zinc/manganese transport system substrate-binding protein